MTPEHDGMPGRETRIFEVLAEYLHAIEQGKPRCREELLDRNPDLAAELGAFLDDEDRMYKLTRALQPAAGDDDLDLPAGEPARYLGVCALQGEIARGGMGVILKGHDAGLGRDLAIKVLRKRHHDDPDARRRFIEEARLGGQLQHPGIVPVHGLSTLADGRPFFAMKLVQGRTLAALLGERAGPDTDRPRFLNIFEQVCHTVAYAHAQGVIHRDLKPANVMVGAFGEVHVMDWGLAKILAGRDAADGPLVRPEPPVAIRMVPTDSSGAASRGGAVLGTPAYMAPEQARGETYRLDERADVFGLGSILCEVLTGAPPYAAGTPGEVHERAARGDLARALERLATCGADEELLILARDCLAPEPAARPRHAGKVADRISAYLQGVQERLRAAELERAESQARTAEEKKRRRLAVVLAATIVLAALLLGASWLDRERVRLARAARVDQELAAAAALRDRAEHGPAADPGPWTEALAAARRAEALLGEDPDRHHQKAVRALIARLAQHVRQAQADRTLLARLDDLRETQLDHFGGATSNDEYPGALREYGIDIDRLSLEQAALLRGRSPQVATALASALDFMAGPRRNTSNALPPREYLIALARCIDPDPWRDGVRALLLTKDTTARTEALLRQARAAPIDTMPVASITLVAGALLHAGRHRDALAVLQAARVGHADDAWINFNLGLLLLRADPPEPDEGIRFLTAARAVRPALGHSLAHVLLNRGRPEEAIAVYHDLIRLRPDVPEHQTCLAQVLTDQRRRADAEPILQRAVKTATNAVRLRPQDATTHYYLANAVRARGDREDAIASYRKALSLLYDFPLAHYALGDMLQSQGELDAAAGEFRAALRIDPGRAEAHLALGRVLHTQGHIDGAIAEYRAALRFYPGYAAAHHHLGDALVDRGQIDAAIAEYRAAVHLSPASPKTHLSLGIALASKGRFDEAMVAHREAIRLRPDYPEAYAGLGYALHSKHDLEGAMVAYRTALRLRPGFPEAHNNLGIVLQGRNELDAAIAEFRGAIQHRKDFIRPYVHLVSALRAKGGTTAAIAECRELVRLLPDDAESHCTLGTLLQDNGDLADALREFERGHELGARNPQWSKPSAEWVRTCRRLVELDARLPSILRGDDRPANTADAADWVALARICARRQRPAAAARLWAGAFEAQPSLVEDRKAQNRLLAARAAALAGAGAGQDEPPLDETARSRWRRQALDWLRDELLALTSQVEKGPPAVREDVRKSLDRWLRDPDLAGLRDEAGLVQLPEAQRAACRDFWAEVQKQLEQASGSDGALPSPGEATETATDRKGFQIGELRRKGSSIGVGPLGAGLEKIHSEA